MSFDRSDTLNIITVSLKLSYSNLLSYVEALVLYINVPPCSILNLTRQPGQFDLTAPFGILPQMSQAAGNTASSLHPLTLAACFQSQGVDLVSIEFNRPAWAS